jgi:hypothetical protein
MARHLHIDPLGGMAGDMFAAAMLDLEPSWSEGLVDALRSAGLERDVVVRWEGVTDEVLAGTRFIVEDPREKAKPVPPSHAILVGSAAGHHAHVPFTRIKADVERSGLPSGVIARAVDIFTHLARAEARVHGFGDVGDVEFHEVGAQDSVADIVAAAWLLERAGVTSSSTGPIPTGSGTVKTAHGVLPIPAPATAILLEGMRVHDDGRPGERVTPTGAAILKHLAPSTSRPAGVLGRTGIGWGTKRFPGLANIVRVTLVEPSAALATDEVSVLAFEIDDQPAEDLAVALEHVRALPGVLDVVQAPAFGKKGRMMTAVRVLARTDVEDAVVHACLVETTTLGVRITRERRVVLAREDRVVDGVRVKRAARPDGTTTAKADIDDVASLASAHARRRRRGEAEDA